MFNPPNPHARLAELQGTVILNWKNDELGSARVDEAEQARRDRSHLAIHFRDALVHCCHLYAAMRMLSTSRSSCRQVMTSQFRGDGRMSLIRCESEFSGFMTVLDSRKGAG